MKFLTLLTTAVALLAQVEAGSLRPRPKAEAIIRRQTKSTTTSTKTSSTKTTSSSSTKTTSSSSIKTTSSTSTRSSSTTSTTSSSSKSSTTSTTSTTSITSSVSSTTSSASSQPTGPLVVAHWMLITTPVNGDYTADIQRAKAAGVDAFAVNYGGWNIDINIQNGYLTKIFQAAAANNFKAFLSVDLTSTSTSGQGMTPDFIISLYNMVYQSPAYLKINNQPVLSSFQTSNPSWNWQTDVLNKLPQQAYFIPGTIDANAQNIFSQNIGANGYFPWIHPYLSPTDEMNADAAMASQRSSTGKLWMAPLAPWFFKRFDQYSNWGHAQDGDIFVTRALNLLKLKPDMIQLVTWNDWGESSYFGPYDTTNQCPSCYWAKVDHSGALTVLASIIKAYKAGQTTISTANNGENVFMYYRRQPNNVIGSSGDNGLPLPQNSESWTNRVFVVGMFNQQTTVSLNSGGTTTTLTFPAGLSQQAVAWTLGPQTISASRNGATIVGAKAGPQIVAQLTNYDGNVVWV